MKLLISAMILGLLVAGTSPVEAAVKKQTVKKSRAVSKAKAPKKVVKKSSTRGELHTDVAFDDAVSYGEYQSPDEALAKVENEKSLSDLLGVRKHFKDRLAEAAEQE